jgi:hypothetical protein
MGSEDFLNLSKKERIGRMSGIRGEEGIGSK